jgi:predicted enzyme related to lactoylglutathione lyase
LGIIPHNDVGCAIISGEGYKPPGPNGPIVYMDANPDLDIILNRIENAGRKIIKPKKAISEDHRFMATFLDSEGNRMALHSLK